MFVGTNDFVTGRKPPVTTNEPGLQVMRFQTALTAADVAAGSIGAVGMLPATAIPVSIIFDTDATNGVGMVAQFGVLPAINSAAFSTAAVDGGAGAGGLAWGASVAATAALTAQQVLSRTMLNDVQPSNSDRFIGMKITTAPTAVVAQTVGVTLFYRQP